MSLPVASACDVQFGLSRLPQQSSNTEIVNARLLVVDIAQDQVHQDMFVPAVDLT